MRILLDTHALLWFYNDDQQLSTNAKRVILDENNIKLVSPASYWEIAIKVAKGKYLLSKPLAEVLHEAIDLNGFAYLHIIPTHVAHLIGMAPHHNDPFDRLLVAQAISERIPLLSADADGISRIW